MRKEIVTRVGGMMEEVGLDVVLAASPENFSYLTGFVVPSQKLLRWRHAIAVLAADGREALVAVDMEASTVRAKAPETELRVWGEFSGDPMATLGDLLEEMGLSGGRIGIETDFLPAGDFQRLQAKLPDARFEAVEARLARIRQIKTQDEIELLARLSRIADQAITDAFSAVKAGDSEMDIAAALTRGVYAEGAEQFTLMIVATGERSVFPNVGPTHRRLQKGDVCRVEIFPIIGGYHAGVCRTAVVQEAPPHAERIWAQLVECKYLILDMIRPGASSRAIYEAFAARMKAMELPPISFVGHGIGLHLHEDPYLGPFSDVPLEAGMVLGMEPLVYQTGHGFGLQNKDMVLVTETGSRLLSDFADTDKLLVVK
jgi:Xaa-Pro dipeptidase